MLFPRWAFAAIIRHCVLDTDWHKANTLLDTVPCLSLTQRVYGKLNACPALLFCTVCRARVYTTDAPPRRVCRAKYGVQTRWYRFPNRHQKNYFTTPINSLARFIN